MSVRMGLNREGLKKLKSSGKVLSPIEYDEYFYNWEKMKQNIWEKQVVFLTPNASNGHYVVKTKPEVNGSVGEYISYFIANPEDLEHKELVASFKVKRTTVIENLTPSTWRANIDEVTFEGGDPHCVCSFVLEKDFTNVELIEEIGLFPIRSKIIEYLFRYEPEKYEELLKLKIVDANQFYIQCITAEQKEEMMKKSNVEEIKDRMNWIMESDEMVEAFTKFVQVFERKLEEQSVSKDSYRKAVDKEKLEASFQWPNERIYCKMYFATDEYFVFTPSGRKTFTEQDYEKAVRIICENLKTQI